MHAQMDRPHKAVDRERDSTPGKAARFENTEVRALIFDLDGTLYNPKLVQRKMFLKFAKAHITSPKQGLKTLRAVNSYRRALELLRSRPSPIDDIHDAQTSLAREQTGFPKDFIAQSVKIWMQREPILVLNECQDAQLVSFLNTSRNRGLRLGVFSDYPATEKLTALGLDSYFDAVVSASDPEVRTLKPNPRGLEVVLQRLGVSRNEAVYIGDRPEVDAAAAGKLGMKCFILGATKSDCVRWKCTSFANFQDLALALFPAERDAQAQGN